MGILSAIRYNMLIIAQKLNEIKTADLKLIRINVKKLKILIIQISLTVK